MAACKTLDERIGKSPMVPSWVIPLSILLFMCAQHLYQYYDSHNKDTADSPSSFTSAILILVEFLARSLPLWIAFGIHWTALQLYWRN